MLPTPPRVSEKLAQSDDLPHMRRTQRSAEAASWQWLYNTGRWRKVRKLHLASEPLCRMCADEGRITAAQVVDHIKAHKGDEALFWDMGNLSSLCVHCHNRHKKREEMSGRKTPVIGLDGWPV